MVIPDEILDKAWDAMDDPNGYLREACRKSLYAFVDALQQAGEYKLVKAPDGYRFQYGDVKASVQVNYFTKLHWQGQFRVPITPVNIGKTLSETDNEWLTRSVTTEDVYLNGIKIPAEYQTGWAVEFGELKKLKAAGFTHYLEEWGRHVGTMPDSDLDRVRICFKKVG